MTYSRVIPNYDLYGDQASPRWNHSFNFEWIPQRSAIYQWVIHPHRHEAFAQVLYLTAGKVDFLIDDRHLQAHAPCLLVIPAGHVHGFRFSSDVQGPVVTAPQRALESVASVAMPDLLATVRQPRLIPLQDEMRHVDQLMPLFLALEQESRIQASGHMAAGTALLLALLVQVHRIVEALEAGADKVHQPAPRRARQIEKFRALVDRHFREHWPLQRYAEQLGVTAGQLSRRCREVLGLSGLDVINARLLHEAQRDLVYTHLPIKQLAAELGFEDDAYFSRFFRKHLGVSPTAFRSQALQQMQAAVDEPKGAPVPTAGVWVL